MRLGAHHAHFPPVFPPSPPPYAAETAGHGKMIASVFMALLLPCVGMSVVFVIYLCLLWYSTRRRRDNLSNVHGHNFQEPVKPVTGKGLSVSELEKLPKLSGQELAAVGRSTECAVCLEEIESGQPARLVPGCNHGFHQSCADAWLSDHTVCPVCRAELGPKLFESNKDESPC